MKGARFLYWRAPFLVPLPVLLISCASSAAPVVNGFKEVCVEADIACAINADGAIECWGEADWPIQPPTGGEPYRDLDCSYVGCALRVSGEAECWWMNGADPDLQDPQLAVPDGEYIDLAVGELVCGLRPDGTPECWDEWPEPGAWPPDQTPADETFVSIGAGSTGACGLREGDGSVVCWGPFAEHPMPAGVGYAEVAVGTDNACVLDGEGAVDCWAVTLAFEETEARPLRGLTVGEDYACAIDATTLELECWGAPIDAWEDMRPGVIVNGAPDGQFVDVDAGDWAACGVRLDGTLECFGSWLASDALYEYPDP